jgi:hypothetical protein
MIYATSMMLIGMAMAMPWPRLHDSIAQHVPDLLREAYEDVAAEPVPDDLRVLLGRLGTGFRVIRGDKL